jgi:hypothetical protein
MPSGPIERYLTAQVRQDLARKMVFVGGPRQVGKTTLARILLGRKSGYLSWDVPEHREKILARELPNSSLWVFDELHKYRSWRGYLKGLYDVRRQGQQILVTGSARLDYYRFGGDSLQGRYHYLRLHPLSVAELGLRTSKELAGLSRLGGFPEPYLSGTLREARRWSREYRSRLIREDVASVEQIQDLGNLELTALRLPELVGSPLSINGLSLDVGISPKTMAKWLAALERLYAIFRLPPFGAPRLRAIKKAQKHYHFDWSVVSNPPARFENVVAAHLLKWVHYQQDTQGRELELRYFRDVAGREVDFVVHEGKVVHWMVEVKSGDAEVAPGLRYLKARFPTAEAWQVSATGKKDYRTAAGIRVCPAIEFLLRLV